MTQRADLQIPVAEIIDVNSIEVELTVEQLEMVGGGQAVINSI